MKLYCVNCKKHIHSINAFSFFGECFSCEECIKDYYNKTERPREIESELHHRKIRAQLQLKLLKKKGKDFE